MGLLPENLGVSGRVRFRGEDLTQRSERHLTTLRGGAIAMIFQAPMAAMNPVMRVGTQVAEPLTIHRGLSRRQAREVAVDLLSDVGIDEPERRANAYPHEMSGGQRQRAMLAMALACGPDLVIADEPTTALDVTVQAQVISVLEGRLDGSDSALLLITHDLPVVAGVTSDVLVLHEGKLVDSGPTAELFRRPLHPYTRQLVEAVPPMSRTGVVPDKAPPPASGETVIETSDVVKTFRLRRRRLTDPAPVLTAVDHVDLDVRRGETFGIVGESGSGKSTLARMLVGLIPPDTGRIVVDGTEVSAGGDLTRLRRSVQMVFQDPMGSLDPRMLVRDIIAEPLRSLRIGGDHRRRTEELLEAVAMPSDAGDRFPHEFSGGQRQRIAIARALAPNPSIVVADEPVSALDMSVQAVTLDLLARLKEDFELTLLFISHDLSVIHRICDRVAVMDRGRVVEVGDVGQVLAHPSTDYTRRLIASIPRLDGTRPSG